MARYAFMDLNCLRLTARPRRSDKAVRGMLARMGFTYEGTMRRFFGPHKNDDAMVFALMRENAGRWLT
jgi:RimJ/RimL family protein N-acetyltransferase